MEKKRNYLNGYIECTIQYYLTFFERLPINTKPVQLYETVLYKSCAKGENKRISLNQKCNIIFSNRASKREHLREAGQLYKLGKSRLLIGAAENSGNNAIFIYYLNNRGAYTLEGATRGRYVPLVMGSSESRVRFEQIHIDKVQIRIFPFRNLK